MLQLVLNLQLLCERRERTAQGLGRRLMSAREENNVLHYHFAFGRASYSSRRLGLRSNLRDSPRRATIMWQSMCPEVPRTTRASKYRVPI